MVYHVIESRHDRAADDATLQSFDGRHEALIACALKMKAHLTGLNEPDLSAGALFDKWQREGLGYRIDPEDTEQAPFCDVDYARLYVLRLTGDYSHPLLFEITTTDRLRTASGVRSQPKNWTFWVKAPTTYATGDIGALMRAGTELLYDDMSQKSEEADGSSLELLDTNFRLVDESEIKKISADSSAMIYAVHDDGSFRKAAL